MEIHQIGGLGYDSNIYLIVDEIISIIDSGTGENFGIVNQNINKLGIAPSDIKMVINTHCHFDHVGGNIYFMESGVGVAIHELEADFLRRGDQSITLAGLFGGKLPSIEVTHGLHDGDQIKLGDLKLDVVLTPGHTRGSMCLHDPDIGILFSGDTVFCGDVGRTDLPTSDTQALGRSLRKLGDLGIEKLYPGHGPSVKKNAREQIAMAIDLYDRPR